MFILDLINSPLPLLGCYAEVSKISFFGRKTMIVYSCALPSDCGRTTAASTLMQRYTERTKVCCCTGDHCNTEGFGGRCSP